MRVLFVLSDLTYPPREGLHEQFIELGAGLRAAGVQVDLCGFVKDTASVNFDELYAKHELRFVVPAVVSTNSILRLGVENFLSRHRGNQINHAMRSHSYDVVHLWGAGAAGLYRPGGAGKTVVSWIDALSLRFERLSEAADSRLEKIKLLTATRTAACLEAALSRPEISWHVVSEPDARYLYAKYRHISLWCIPLSIPERITATPCIERERTIGLPTRVLVPVDLRAIHMRWALKELLNEVIYEMPDEKLLEFTILGRIPEIDFENLFHFNRAFITYVEWVRDFGEAQATHDIVILPDTVGTGMKNRAIQALAAGCAVLGTPVAFEGIPIVTGEHAIVYHSNCELLEWLMRFTTEPELAKTLGVRGAQFARQHFGRRQIIDTWIAHYESLMSLQ